MFKIQQITCRKSISSFEDHTQFYMYFYYRKDDFPCIGQDTFQYEIKPTFSGISDPYNNLAELFQFVPK